MAGGVLQGIFAGLVFVTVALAAFAIGALVSSEDLKVAIRTPSFSGLLALNVVVIPLLGLLISWMVPLDSSIETGLLLCSVCAGGPLSLKVCQLCDADLPWTLSLTVTLLLLNVVTVPLWSPFLLGRTLTLSGGDLIGTLLAAIVIPVLIGVWAKRRTLLISTWSDRAIRVSNLTLVLAVLIGVVSTARDLVSLLSTWGLVAAMAVVVVSALLGWSLPQPARRRRANSLVTLNRATSVALLVVGRVYLDDAEVLAAVVLFGVVQTSIAVVLSLLWATVDCRLALPPGSENLQTD